MEATIGFAALQAQSEAAAESDEDPGLDARLRELWLNAPTEQDLTPDTLACIRQPVMVLSGDRDLVRLEHTLAIYQSLPNARLFVLPDTGHGTFATRPELATRSWSPSSAVPSPPAIPSNHDMGRPLCLSAQPVLYRQIQNPAKLVFIGGYV